MDVYLDTNLWNALFNQSIRVDVLLDSLEKRDIRLVLSDESLNELAKTFLRGDDTGKERAAALFNYLQAFVARSIPIAKENMDAIAAEMQSLQWMAKEVFPFINASDYETGSNPKIGHVPFAHTRTSGRFQSRRSTVSNLVE